MSKKIIYILDYFSYIETSNYESQPSRLLGFIFSLGKNDFAIVPKSLSNDLEILKSFNNIVLTNLIFVTDENKKIFYLEIENIVTKIIRRIPNANIITYSFSLNIENIFKKNNILYFNKLKMAQIINNKSNPIINSKLFPTLNRKKIRNIKQLKIVFNKYSNLFLNGIVIKKEIDELGIGNLFIKNIDNIEPLLVEFGFLFNKKNSFIIEPWLSDDYIHYNYQIVINRVKNSNIDFLGASEQFFEEYETESYKRVFFKGNVGPIEINKKHYSTILKVANEISKTGYFGIVGIDLYSNGSNYGIMEFNCRFNSATSLYFYNQRINNILAERFWLMTDFEFKNWNSKQIKNYFDTKKLFFDQKKRIGVKVFSITNFYVQVAIIGKSKKYVKKIFMELENIDTTKENIP